MHRADLELVLAIRAHGTLSAAALHLDITAPAVTKRLATIERQLGQRLFLRTTRRVSATAEGDVVCEHAQTLLQGFQDMELDLQTRQAEPSGQIRLAATFGFGRLWLGPAVARFQQRHPRITVQLQLTEQLPDLAAEGYDGAVWLWAVQGRQASQWTSRQLAANQRVLVAAPAYLARHGTPARVEDLARHACLIARENGNSTGPRFDVWQLQHVQSGTPAKVRIQGPLASNSGELVRDWCVGGNGIMLRSLWDIAPLLTNGQLVRVLPDWAMPDANIHWLAPWRAQTPKRVRLLTDYLVEQFQDAPWRINP